MGSPRSAQAAASYAAIVAGAQPATTPPARVPASQIAWTSRARVSSSVARESCSRAEDVFISERLDPQVRVLGDQRRHLPQSDRSGTVRGPADGAHVLPGEALDPLHGEGDAAFAPDQLEVVVAIDRKSTRLNSSQLAI